MSFEALVEQLFMGTDGLFGLPPGAAASMIFAFIMFGAFLERTGMNTLFIAILLLQFILNRLERRKGEPGGARMGTAGA